MNPLTDSVIQGEEREIACGLDPACHDPDWRGAEPADDASPRTRKFKGIDHQLSPAFTLAAIDPWKSGATSQ
jgi:hypothetical protein